MWYTSNCQSWHKDAAEGVERDGNGEEDKEASPTGVSGAATSRRALYLLREF